MSADRRPVRQVRLVRVDDTDAHPCDKDHPIPLPQWLVEMRLPTIGRVDRPEWPEEGRPYEGRHPHHMRLRPWHFGLLVAVTTVLLVGAALFRACGR